MTLSVFLLCAPHALLRLIACVTKIIFVAEHRSKTDCRIRYLIHVVGFALHPADMALRLTVCVTDSVMIIERSANSKLLSILQRIHRHHDTSHSKLN